MIPALEIWPIYFLEIQARLKWTPAYQIMYALNEVPSRLLAKLRANDLWFILYRQNRLPSPDYQVPIVFYDVKKPSFLTANEEDTQNSFWEKLPALPEWKSSMNEYNTQKEHEILNTLLTLVNLQNKLIEHLQTRTQAHTPDRNNLINSIQTCFKALPCHYVETIRAFSTHYQLPELQNYFPIFPILHSSLPPIYKPENLPKEGWKDYSKEPVRTLKPLLQTVYLQEQARFERMRAEKINRPPESGDEEKSEALF